MLRVIKLPVSVIVLFSLFAFGCSSGESREEVADTLTPASNTTYKPSTRIREIGWSVPIPTRKKKVTERVETATSENGKSVAIKEISYAPIGEYIITDELFSENGHKRASEEKLRLAWFTEFRAGGKPYLYSIGFDVVREKPKESVVNNDIGLSVVYVISDRDGDGKFETMYPGDVDRTVPSWVIDKSNK